MGWVRNVEHLLNVRILGVLLLDDAVLACQEFPTGCLLPLIWAAVRAICHLERDAVLKENPNEFEIVLVLSSLLSVCNGVQQPLPELGKA